ncbi:hypothetical protein WQ56_14490 [Luteimonas sp. FCS-9]|nr:hypothetical protein WQ56_14490 [Luteimonas sp. FCS-9]
MPDTEFDPDDNFAFLGDGRAEAEDDPEAEIEAVVWQWLLLVNPGDEEAAGQQFRDWQETVASHDDLDAVRDALLAATDWRASFRIAEDDRVALVEALVELAARFRVDIDWDLEDPTDARALADVPPSALLGLAHDQLRVAGYTLWTWETGDDTFAGAIAARDDDDGMRAIGHALGLELRPGA